MLSYSLVPICIWERRYLVIFLAFLKMRDWWSLCLCLLAELPRQVSGFHTFVLWRLLGHKCRVLWCFSRTASTRSQPVRLVPGPQTVRRAFGPPYVSQGMLLVAPSWICIHRTSVSFPVSHVLLEQRWLWVKGREPLRGYRVEGVSGWDGASDSVLQLGSVGPPPAQI